VESITETFGRNFREILSRNSTRLNQKAVAEKLGVAPNTIQNWIHGRKLPESAERIEELAAILGCAPQDFFALETRPAPTLSEALRTLAPLLAALDRLPDLTPVTELLDALAQDEDERRR
jgi:transcriptional regulator with XRE-family HTH domain